MPIDILKDDLQLTTKALNAKEETLNHIEALNKLGSWELDIETNKVTWSKQSFLNYGYEPYSFEPNLEFFFSHLTPYYIPLVQEALKNVLSTGKRKAIQCKIIRPL